VDAQSREYATVLLAGLPCRTPGNQ